MGLGYEASWISLGPSTAVDKACAASVWIEAPDGIATFMSRMVSTLERQPCLLATGLSVVILPSTLGKSGTAAIKGTQPLRRLPALGHGGWVRDGASSSWRRGGHRRESGRWPAELPREGRHDRDHIELDHAEF